MTTCPFLLWCLSSVNLALLALRHVFVRTNFARPHGCMPLLALALAECQELLLFHREQGDVHEVHPTDEVTSQPSP